MSAGIGFDFGFGKKKAVVQGDAGAGAAQYTPPEGLKYPQPVNEPTPDWEDVRQEYPQYPVVNEVPVTVKLPVKAWSLPAKRAIVRSFHVPPIGSAGVLPLEIIPADPRIKNAYITSSPNNPGGIFLGTKEQVATQIVANSDAYFYENSQTLGPWQGFNEALYAVAESGSSTNIINVRLEFWAD